MDLKSCILLIGLFLQLTKAELRLELVQVLFRHGDRTPRAKELYPNDPYNISTYEPWGLGQLTNQGKMREYIIGKMLRQRYNTFLSDIFRPTDAYAVTTDIDRTKMSLQLVLAGLFSPSSAQTWKKDLPWMPVPVQYMPEKIDMLMKGHTCPLYLKALNEVRNSAEVLKRASQFKDFYKFLTGKLGMEIVNSSQVYEVFHLLTSQKFMNLTMPEWCTDDVYAKVQDVVMLDYEIRSYTTQLKRLHSGALIKRFIDNMNVNDIRKDPRKIYLYSAHESNIAAFTKAHNLSEPKVPAYGSAMIMEKLRDASGKVNVRILLWTGVTEELITLKLPNCGEICPLQKYMTIVQDILPSEKEENCLWDSITREELQQMYKEKINLD